MDVIKKRIEVRLTGKEIKFISTIGKELYGADSIQEAMQRIFYLQLREDMDLYEKEMED